MVHMEGNGPSLRLSLVWFARLHGDYLLVITVLDRGALTRTLSVP